MGGWSEAYLFGGEEWELSWRLDDMGYELLVDADIEAKHDADFERGQGASHSFVDMRFVYNSYINRVLFAQRNFGFTRVALFRVLLLFHLLLVVPLRWSSVGASRGLLSRTRAIWSVARYVVFRGADPVTMEELNFLAGRRAPTGCVL